MSEQEKVGIKNLPIRRRAITVSQEEIVKTEFLDSEKPLPMIVRPAIDDVDLIGWAKNHKEFIESRLLKYGALLFRGFNLKNADDFNQVVEAISGGAMEYRERSSPRSQVRSNIYTSTDYPAEQSIFPHNEHSYSLTFPLRLYFFCETPALANGETPLGDTRKILSRISPETRERFIGKKWMYVRNFGDGLSLPWQTVFQTTDKIAVELYCRRSGIEFEWKPGDRLRTRQVRPVVATHPRTGELVWFNHATFFHVTTLEPRMRDALTAEFGDDDLPNNTFYGDGSAIEPQVLDELRDAYQKEMVSFAWQKGDLILLDNMLTAHARAPFVGPRKVLFAMAEPFTREDI